MAERILHCFLFALLAVLVDARLEAADTAIARPSPTTVRDWQSRKYGMFIHFGLYSMLGGVWKGRKFSGNYSEQIQSDAHIPSAEYANSRPGSTRISGTRTQSSNSPRTPGCSSSF
jgi:alpha-L-fucosidase